MSVRRAIPSGRAGRTTRRTALVAVVGAVLLAVTGCSGSSSPGPSSADAAGAVTEVFRLPDGTRQCLADQFGDQASARDALTSSAEPGRAAQDALFGAVDACVTSEQVAGAVATSISAALPPPDTSRAEAQTACLRTEVLDLDADQHRTLVVGLLVLGAPPDGELATARNDLVNSLYAACGVTVGP